MVYYSGSLDNNASSSFVWTRTFNSVQQHHWLTKLIVDIISDFISRHGSTKGGPYLTGYLRAMVLYTQLEKANQREPEQSGSKEHRSEVGCFGFSKSVLNLSLGQTPYAT